MTFTMKKKTNQQLQDTNINKSININYNSSCSNN